MAGDRDRDPGGRARSARPRDALGRPLPRGAPGEPTMPEDLLLGDAETVALAQRLLDAGRPFHAHEVLEGRWKAVSDPHQRRLWQGLAQLAVGITHQARGNDAGARRLIQRGREGVAAGLSAGSAPPDLDTGAVLQWADAWLAGQRGRPLRLAPPVGAGP